MENRKENTSIKEPITVEKFNMKEFQKQLKEKFEKEKKEDADRQALLTEQGRKKSGHIKLDPVPDFDDVAPVKKRGDIPFEPPLDFDDRPGTGNIKLDDPVEPTIETRIEQIERGQGKIIMMLQMLLNN